MNNLRNKIVTLFLFSVIALTPITSFAQIDPGCDPDDPACPIDGGVGLLIAAAILVQAKRSLQEKSRNTIQ